jgi:phosphate acyltransferase
VTAGSMRPEEPSIAEPVVAVDANGADLGPREVAAGAALAAERGIKVMLFGPLARLGALPAGIEVIDAPVSIAKSADPAGAARSTPEASIVQAARAVAQGRAHALVCAGGTGAALAAGLFNIKRARGIYRPALALPLPVPGTPVTLLDVGANVEARREHLVQFAFMGAALANGLLAIDRPRVGLLSNGEEAARGAAAVVEAHAALAMLDAHRGAFRFVGNVEGGDVVKGVADVIVTDGFTGNVALKLIEGVSQTLLGAVKGAATGSWRGKLGGALLHGSLRSLAAEIDPESQGGAYLLGLRQLGVVPHGGFTRTGFERAIVRAHQGVCQDIVGSTLHALGQAGALRTVPAPSGGELTERDAAAAQAVSLPRTQ